MSHRPHFCLVIERAGAGMAPFKVGDRLRLRPATAVFAGQHIHAVAEGSVIETRETSVGSEMIPVMVPAPA